MTLSDTDIIASFMNYIGTLQYASFNYIDTNITNDIIYNIALA